MLLKKAEGDAVVLAGKVADHLLLPMDAHSVGVVRVGGLGDKGEDLAQGHGGGMEGEGVIVRSGEGNGGE